MINKKQYQILKEYSIEPLRAKKDATFHALAHDGFIRTVLIENKDYYKTADKGLAEIENYESENRNSIVSYIALGVGIVSLILTILFKFFV